MRSAVKIMLLTGFKRGREITNWERRLIYAFLYLLLLLTASILVHEAAHVVTALIFGVGFAELTLGFNGINPSVILPQWFNGAGLTVTHYAGGFMAGAMLLLLYLIYWVGRYRCHPTPIHWVLGLLTLMLATAQLAIGYLEGHYHAAYIAGAGSLFSPTDIMAYGWALSAVFFHTALCPGRRLRRINSEG